MFARRLFLLGRASKGQSRVFHSSPAVWRKVVHKFKLVDIGEGITECEVIKWNVVPKASVQAFDPLCEVQSDKASVEITSPFDGVVKQLLVDEGQVAKVGEGLCLIEVDEESTLGGEDSQSQYAVTPTLAPTPPPPSASASAPAPAPTQRRLHPLDPNYVPPQQPSPTRLSRSSSAPSPSTKPEDIFATPSVRHFARKNGVELGFVAPGSGRDGRVEKKDVEAYLARGAAAGSSDASTTQVKEGEDVVVELGRTRYNMWKAMTKSLEIPTFGYTTTLDLTPLYNLLPALNASIPAHYLLPSQTASGTDKAPIANPSAFYPVPAPPSIPDSGQYAKLTFLPILLKTLSKAMMEWPIFRSSLTPTNGNTTTDTNTNGKPTLTLRPHTDISLALSTPTGLYTPTLLSTDQLSIYALASQITHLSHLGRQIPCGLGPKEMPKRGGTISVSNIGAVGRGDSAVPVLVEGGGVAIAVFGRARWVWDVEGEGKDGKRGRGEERLKMSVSWSADHRVVEGAELAAFVESWRRWVEVPERLIGEGV
ncbi:hypothetical protein AX15_004793 [Amanita polypyramis BW_CC]|nr:hypothetical protein AX15_004793 [Amanita polypyramis BW_CC]